MPAGPLQNTKCTGGMACRPLLKDSERRGGREAGQPWPTRPPTHIRKFFRRKKEIYEKGRKVGADFRYTELFFFWPVPHSNTKGNNLGSGRTVTGGCKATEAWSRPTAIVRHTSPHPWLTHTNTQSTQPHNTRAPYSINGGCRSTSSSIDGRATGITLSHIRMPLCRTMPGHTGVPYCTRSHPLR